MTVRSVEQGADPEVLSVGLRDGSCFFIRTSYLDASLLAVDSLYPEKELSEEEFGALARAAEGLRAERSALRLIALREHSRAELAMKLRKRGFGDSDASAALDRLVGEGLVDDERFAELWTESRIIRRNEGASVLIAKLRGRGVSREIARRAVSKVLSEGGETALALRFIRAEGGSPQRQDPALRERLRKAGFGSSAIREAFDLFES